MMNAPLVSVVIPLFNARDFIEECVTSVMRQTYPNKEVIIVNDGSTDGSYEIAQALQEKYPEITLLTQDNAGPSAARNKGMDYATGDYITFPDSDDFLEGVALEKAVHACLKYQANIILYNMVMYTLKSEDRHLGWPIHLEEECINPSQDDRCMWFTNTAPSLIKLSFLRKNTIRFVEGLLYEDWEFMSQIYASSNAVMLLSEALYYYRRGWGRKQISADVSMSCTDILHAYQRADKNLSARPHLRFANDVKLLREASLFYAYRVQRFADKPVKKAFLDLYKKILISFPNTYLRSLCGALERRERKKFRKALFSMRAFKFLLGGEL